MKDIEITTVPLPVTNDIRYKLKGCWHTFVNDNKTFAKVRSIDFLVSVGTQYALITYTDGKERKVKASKAFPIIGIKDNSDIEQKVKDLQAYGQSMVCTIQIETNISDVYEESTPYSNGSCMQGLDYAKVYDLIEDCKGIVTIRNGQNELLGRALLWYIELNGENVQFIDKCYIAKEDLKPQFEQFVKDNKYYTGYSLYSADKKKLFISPCGKEITQTVNIQLDKSAIEELEDLPYFDRFTSYDTSKECLNNNYNGIDLQETGGGNPVTGSMTVYSERHGCRIDEDDAVYSEYYDSYIYANEAIYCEHENDYVESDDALQTPDGCWWIKDNCIF